MQNEFRVTFLCQGLKVTGGNCHTRASCVVTTIRAFGWDTIPSVNIVFDALDHCGVSVSEFIVALLTSEHHRH